jgi:tRNA 2-thiouridine synthesizing protein E
MTFLYQGKEFATDKLGYLKNHLEWSIELGEAMAAADGLSLSEDHWEVINFLREYHEDYRVAPPIRMLVRAIRQAYGPSKGNSRYLYALFPDGPAKQASKYAGLPKPKQCV